MTAALLGFLCGIPVGAVALCVLTVLLTPGHPAGHERPPEAIKPPAPPPPPRPWAGTGYGPPRSR